MAKNSLREYDTTASNNTDIAGIGIQGTNLPSNFDNAFRTIMKHIADWQAGTAAVIDGARFCDPSDTTKQVRLDAGNVTTATTRVLFMPDADVSISSFSTTLLDDTSASAWRTTLGLGTSATVNTGTSGATIPLLSTSNTWSSEQLFTAASSGATAITFSTERSWSVKQRGAGASANLSFENTTGKAIEFSSEATYTAPQITLTPSGGANNTIAITGAGLITLNGGASTGVNGTSVTAGTITNSRNAATTQTHVSFANSNGTVGSISTNGTTTAYNTTSDETLKDFIGPYDPQKAIEIIRADPVRDFHWKGTGAYAVGWGAQTSYAVSPDLASPPEEVGQPWGVDQSKRTPYLWAALSWAIDKIEELEAKVSALEG
ncbi:hypothetical protein CO661_14235 [Sinorhizobium fredii]|uniref:Peptidase S74 domain-containing protein n=1 Tax=Rhizobium fredii TaxID=380 RepID=A0A2A6LYC4_RHIFR|nr:hypothetical protein [Sinorhizobium fredii]PDT47337.1 hypothetical protein CO661_14235 [Sinorhizobium fredii]